MCKAECVCWSAVGSHLPVLPELHCEGTVHMYGPLTSSVVGVTLQHQVALLFVDHSATLWNRHTH